MALDPLHALGGTRRAYVVPELKLLYISVAKNACTSLKWLLAELAGEDLTRFRLGAGPFVSPDEGIHVRRRWQRTPKLNEIPVSVRSQISPDNGWFVFGVVRDPRVRLFSAWENKFLLRNPAYTKWRDEPWFPRVPSSPDEVAEDFAAFVEVLHKDPDAAVVQDAHFLPQSPFLSPDVVPYSRIYEISEMKLLLRDLNAHVVEQGRPGDLQLRRSNDTPLKATAQMFGGEVRGRIEEFYAEDFQRFGHFWDFAKIETAPEWTRRDLDELQSRIVLAERINELLGLLAESKKSVAESRATVATKEEAIGRLRREVRALEQDKPRPRSAGAIRDRIRRRVTGSPSA
jgi:hypothetical protein